jgi:hypothetical protein
LMSSSLASLITRERQAKRLDHFPLEDVGVGWWIDQLKGRGHLIDLVDDRRCFVFHYCNPDAFNVLLERGAPMYIDTADIMAQARAASTPLHTHTHTHARTHTRTHARAHTHTHTHTNYM